MPRTGKSLLVDTTNILATGRQMPVTSQGPNDEEFDKRLGGDLLAGALCISIDNCVRPVSGDVLCQVLTQNEVNVRILGHSRNISTATIATIFVNGNNLVIAGDLTDRCILASLDAGTEQPGLRKFKIDVVKEAHARRGELVVAALTILRAWHVARAAGEQVNVDPLGGFEEWSQRVREALIWLGEPDPCDSMGKVRGGDPELEELTTVIEQWKLHLTIGAAYTVQDVIGRAINSTPFHTALMNVAAASGSSNVVSNRRLGRWLKRFEGRIVNGFRLSQTGRVGGYPKWSLKR
jgi:putative DNA primase/helicase